jgi:hypothetical protein
MELQPFERGIGAKTKEDAMILLEKAVPCILHLENRVSECLIHVLLLKALSY